MSHHRTGKTVLLRPESRAECKVRAHYSAAATLWRGARSPETIRNVAAILFNDPRWGKKWERIRAEIFLGNVDEFYSERKISVIQSTPKD